MTKPLSISDLASALVERTRASTVTKVASAPAEAAALEHPLSVALKQAAAALREAPAPGVSMDAVMKIAAAPGQPGTGAQSPSAGNGSGASAPGLPGLKASNLGVVAGGGGAGETMKEASSDLGLGLRKLAAQIREQGAQAARDEQIKAAHVLNAAVGLAHLRAKHADSSLWPENDVPTWATVFPIASAPFLAPEGKGWEQAGRGLVANVGSSLAANALGVPALAWPGSVLASKRLLAPIYAQQGAQAAQTPAAPAAPAAEASAPAPDLQKSANLGQQMAQQMLHSTAAATPAAGSLLRSAGIGAAGLGAAGAGLGALQAGEGHRMEGALKGGLAGAAAGGLGGATYHQLGPEALADLAHSFTSP